eukprot:350832-Chlamydomonas_euryale.AAC.1
MHKSEERVCVVGLASWKPRIVLADVCRGSGQAAVFRCKESARRCSFGACVTLGRRSRNVSSSCLDLGSMRDQSSCMSDQLGSMGDQPGSMGDQPGRQGFSDLSMFAFKHTRRVPIYKELGSAIAAGIRAGHACGPTQSCHASPHSPSLTRTSNTRS